MTSKVKWVLLASGSALVAGALARRAMRGGWRVVMDEEPPTVSSAAHVTPTKALVWTAATTLTATAARLIAQKGAEAGWKAIVGGPPPA